MPEVRPFRLNPGGQVVPSVRVEFEPISEPWSWYKLADGGRLRCRTTAVDIVALLDEHGKQLVNDDGDPMFGIVGTPSNVVLER